MIGKTVAHYKIIKKLGAGGMGVVYQAEDTKLRRSVALKFLSKDLLETEGSRDRFLHEARAAGALAHPNICTIYEINELEGQMYTAMEFLEGESLESRIASGPMGVLESVEISSEISAGLSAAHERGIVHRDINPRNIMITPDGHAKIMDFGIAKSPFSDSDSEKRVLMGTVPYMSPEQVRAIVLDHRTDIWSLGVVLYEMLTGSKPFQGDYEQAIVYSILNEEPEPPIARNPSVPIELSRLVMKALAKDRNRRMQNAKEFRRHLRVVRDEADQASGVGEEKTVAVLPFKNISPGQESDYFSDGLTEELLTGLAKLEDIRVVPKTNSMKYKETKRDVRSIGRELGVQYVIDGSVRRQDNDLRISARIIEVAGGIQLWAETYKGSLADVFDIQEDVSSRIVDALSLSLTPSEKIRLSRRATLDPRAFDLCLRARGFLYQRTKSKLLIAVDLFQEAIDRDPRYADAYAGLGETYATLYQDFESEPALLGKSIDACLKALMYDSTLSEAYAALALSYFHKKSLVEALEASHRAIDLDPNSFVAYWILGRIHHCTNRYKEAVACFLKAIELNPKFYTARKDLSMSYEQMGDREKYDELLLTLLQFYPDYLLEHPDDARARLYYAVNLAEKGQDDEARIQAAKALESNPTDPLMQYNAACFYSRLGDRALAIQSLRASISAGFGYFDWIKADPDLENIRKEPEYIELVAGK